jgi:hypothetical protein
MEQVRLTDYLGIIPGADRMGLLGAAQQSAVGLFLNLPMHAPSKPKSDQASREHAMADFSLIGLGVATLMVVATVVLNWSR